MRLLRWNNRNELSLTENLHDNQLPSYAILSHTWSADSDEVTFTDLQEGRGKKKTGYQKILFCGEQAKRDKIEHFWIDTCCINKADFYELSEAITSMYRWYRNAEKCYVYLSDVPADQSSGGDDESSTWKSSFRSSRWFTRGWTLQELLAPAVVEFFSRDEILLGSKSLLAEEIYEITKIPLAALYGTPPTQFSIAERWRWTQGRQTKKTEDKAYCLLGIFDVFIPLIYGEGDNAFRRLEKEVNERSTISTSTSPDDNCTRSLGLCLNSAPVIKPSDFVGRTAEIDDIYALLRPNSASAEQQRVVLGGIGGMGKTQLAIAYARQHQQSYTSVLWLNATSESTVYAGLRPIAQVFTPADVVEKLDNKQVLTRVHEWLSQSSNVRWLLIFDNYDEPDLFDIDNFCPHTGHGSIIITTRLPELVTGQKVRIQPLQDINNSLAILRTRSNREVEQDVGAFSLAERLNGLPLALVTAGAYLRKSTISFQQYLDTYEQRWQLDPRRRLHLQDYQNRTLFTTWNLSFGRLEKEDLEAAQMLQLLAYFDNQDVWYELFRAGLPNKTKALEWLRTLLGDQIRFESVISTLVDYCLVEIQHASQSYSVHSCVHDWVLGELNREVRPDFYWYAFECVFNSIDQNDWNELKQVKYTRLSRHAARLTHHRFEKCDKPDCGLLEHLTETTWIARMLYHQVQFSAAERIYSRALAECEKAFGTDDIWTLTIVNNLGMLYASQGRLEEAEQMYMRALRGYENTLNPDHTSMLDTIHNLGILFRHQGKLNEAEQMLKQALAGREKALGPDHSTTLETVNNLGILYINQGKLDEAEYIYLRALLGYEKALAPDHITTLDTVSYLGNLYRIQGKLDEAEEMLKQALAGKEKALRPDHPTTLETVNSLGILYVCRGKLDEAEQMYMRALIGYEKALGPGHTMTLDTVTNLGNLYRVQRKLDEAEQMLKRALLGNEKALGSDHLTTLKTVRNLGILYTDQGKLDEAEQMYERALVGIEKAVGPDHPWTLPAVRDLHGLYLAESRVIEAEQIEAQYNMSM